MRHRELIKAEIEYVKKYLEGPTVSYERKVFNDRLKELILELKNQ